MRERGNQKKNRIEQLFKKYSNNLGLFCAEANIA